MTPPPNEHMCDYIETKIFTLIETDVKENRFNYKTEKENYIWYDVIYYDNKHKINCDFTIKVKKGNNILSVIRLKIALFHIEEIYSQLRAPDLENIEEVEAYIEKITTLLKLDKNLDIPSIVERIIHPDFFTEFCYFDFCETSCCEGCRENKFGLKHHIGGCF